MNLLFVTIVVLITIIQVNNVMVINVVHAGIGTYNVDVIFIENDVKIDSKYKQQVYDAISRWKQVIIGTHRDSMIHVNAGEELCTGEPLSILSKDRDIDDLLIFIHMLPIDGPYNIVRLNFLLFSSSNSHMK
jgi:hypothetical protein